MTKLIGTDPNQVPSNADLGTLAYQNDDNVTLGLTTIATEGNTPRQGSGTLLRIKRTGTGTWATLAIEAQSYRGNSRIAFVDSDHPNDVGTTGTANGGGAAPFIFDYEHETEKFQMISNAASRITVDSAGNVGIGTDDPDSKLTVNVSTTGDGIELQSSTTSIASFARSVVDGQVVASIDGVSTRPIHIGGVVNEDVILGYGGGNVGIGTPSPLSKLHVQGNAVIGNIQTYETTNAANSGATLHVHNLADDGTDTDGKVNFGDETQVIISTGAIDGGPQGYQGSLWFGTSDHPAGGNTLNSAGTQWNWKVAGIASKTDQDTASENSAYGNLEFYTKGSNASTSASLAMTIDEAQQVTIGAGTATSSYGLEIQKSDAGAGLYLHRTDTAAMSSQSIYQAFQITQTNGQSARLAEITATGVSGWGGELVFGVKPANGSPNNSATARMWIKESGDIIQGNNGTHSWTSNNTTLFQAGGIGITSNSDWSLQLAGSTTERIRFFSSAGGTATVGNISVDASGTTYTTTSDRRLKKDIEPITDGTDKLMAMNPVTHTWISNPDEPKVHGFIAQEMQKVVPEAVSGNAESDEMMSMDYGRITPVLVAALQEANKKISELEARLNDAGL